MSTISMKRNQTVYVFRSLAIGGIVFLVIALRLHRKNEQLTESNNKLMLQNDSVLSVNLQLQKDINYLKHHLDSFVHNVPEKQQLTAGK